MGIFSRKSKKAAKAEEEDPEFNPYANTSMPVRENKFDAFKDYAAQRQKPNFQPVSADATPQDHTQDYNNKFNSNSNGPKGPYISRGPVGGGPYSGKQQGAEFEESYQDYKVRRAKEQKEQQQRDRLRNGTYRDPNSLNRNYQNREDIQQRSSNDQYDEDDLNVPSGAFGNGFSGAQQQQYDADDLNAPPDSLYNGYEDYNEQQQQQITEEEKAQKEYDEEMEDIKGELSFTRDKSLASTQRTLEMARNAEISGQNTMGLLGSQSERLYNAEAELQLAQVNNKIGTARAKELRTAGNVFRAPQNPFNKKHRLRAKEDRLRADMIQDRTIRDQQRKDFQESERRIKENLYISTKEGTSEQRKTRQEALEAHKQYLYDDEDSEEEEKELQIGHNLNEIHSYAQRLHKIAVAQGDELSKQDFRLDNMTENMDELNIGVEQNRERLRAIVHK